MYQVLDLFSGIGGFSLGLERTGGFKTVAFCEIEEYPRKVLAKHWPEVPIYEDVRELTADRLRADGINPDCITGGFPCQDISVAGKGAGIEGERSGLWSEIARLTSELRPRIVILENVAALLGRGLGRVLGDLSEIGYDAEWHCIPASYAGAPHRRDRIWIIAYPSSIGVRYMPRSGDLRNKERAYPQAECGRDELAVGIATDGERESLAHADHAGLQGRAQTGYADSFGPRVQQHLERCINGNRPAWATEPNVGRVAHGIPNRAHRLKGLGNAVVSQIPELMGRAILETTR